MKPESKVVSDWWWRRDFDEFTYDASTHTTEAKPGEESFWNGGVERASLRYELVRRIQRRKKLPAYPDLTSDERIVVNTALGSKDFVETISIYNPPREHPEPGWSEQLPAWHWNLHASDSALQDHFLKFIEEQRAKFGIEKPKGMAGRPTRPAAWSWPELMDLSEFGLKTPNASERSSISNARRAAREAEQLLVKHVAEACSGACLPLLRDFPNLRLLLPNSKRVARR